MKANTIQFTPVNTLARREIALRAGDSVRVWQKIQEKGKVRLQKFEGLVLCRKHGNEPGGTFLVRAVLSGVGVEKNFPLYSPLIERIEIIKRSKVRQAKLFYIREKVAREIKRQMRRSTLVNISTQNNQEKDESIVENSPSETSAKEA
jgi:large subunit ribosomal protein L19